ncbi:hypothetical protein [Rahnella selenatireducens]|uniref:hypothetical protein n=1 Tax=Rahnella selenatireducens TaxID=3389797 RepID=UPI003969B756
MNGFPAARQGDMAAIGGPIVQGSLGVMIGAPTDASENGRGRSDSDAGALYL